MVRASLEAVEGSERVIGEVEAEVRVIGKIVLSERVICDCWA
jgi:hypothetical protein